MSSPRPVDRFSQFLTVVLLAGSGLLFPAAGRSAADDEEVDLAAHYGFGPLEIFKLERRSHSMLAGDFNHDGRTDLAIVDNSHSRIDLLLQREAPPAGDDVQIPKTANEISSHWRFEHAKIPVDRNVSAMSVGDFNGDGRADLAYFGDPDRLVLRFQPESGDWSDSRQMRLADVEGQAWGIVAGDLNSDGRDDVTVLGKKVTYLILQTSPGEFAPPAEIRNTAERLGLAMIGDLDGDERNDLFYIATDGDTRRASTRLQNEEGRLGPEIRFELKDTRGLVLYDLAEGAGREVVTIDGGTGRARVAQFTREGDPEGELGARLVQYGFGDQGVAKGRDLATGDLNGDGLADVVVTDPNAAQLIVFLQHESYGLDLGTGYPSFLGVEQVRLADIDGDGHAEVFVLSNKEKSIGHCWFENGRVSFPATLPIIGEPVAFELADLDRDGSIELYYLEKTGRKEYALHRLSRENGGEWKSSPVGENNGKLKVSNEPGYMLAVDANLDGRTDLLLTDSAGRAPALLVTDAHGVPRLVETAGGLQLGNVERGAVFSGMLDERVTLVAQENFARNLRLDDQNRWQVLDQYNPVESGAKIAGVAALDLDGQPGNELVLIDTGVNKLRVLRKEGQLYQPWEQVDIGTFPYVAAHVADLNNDQRDDLLVFGAQRFLTVYAGQRPPVLKDVMTFESKLRDALFADLVAGDLNGDGHPDVAMFDIAKQNVEIVTRRGESLVHAINFKVFEEKNFGRRSSEGAQPREAVIADVTGDGRSDLILLVHDRVLVYPQDPGRTDDASTADADQQTKIPTPDSNR
ncbi:MAG: FG-GAP repeat domain-containing protein [Planctomycetaceae bacterium]